MEYHALITGMPVIKADDKTPRVTLPQIRTDYIPQLNRADQRLVGLYLLRYDNRNLIAALAGKDTFDDRALYSRDDIAKAIEAVHHNDTTNRELPDYIYEFIGHYDSLGDIVPEDELSRLYFAHALAAKNDFVRSWFEFERDTNNLFTVFTGEQHGFDARPFIIGDDATSEALRTSTQPDFGLGTSLPYYGDIRRIAAIEDAVDKERELDAYRFRWLADKTFFHYFTVERVFAYVIMVDIIERWSRLDAEKGQQVFRDLIGDISSKAELPEEFR